MNMLLFIILAADTSAKAAQLIAPILSGCAFLLSAAAFIFTVIIQLKERRRNLRQTLSTALSDIARINVEMAKLKKDSKETPSETLDISKRYNSQRGTLVSVADFLISENKKLVTDADCELMALTYNDLGDETRAKQYWEQAIKMAPTLNQKSLHKRDYAAFLFAANEDDTARSLFRETTEQAGQLTDLDFSLICDIYLTWAGFEHDFGNEQEYERLRACAAGYCKKIRHRGKRDFMNGLIDRSGNA